MKKFVKLNAAVLLAAAVNYAEAGCVPPASGQTPLDVYNCFQSVIDAQQKQIKALAVVNKAQQKLIKAQGEEIQALKREQVRLNKEIQAALSLAEKHEAVEERGIEGSIVAE
jgi:ABC-type Na+ efflux pump permease subunit